MTSVVAWPKPSAIFYSALKMINSNVGPFIWLNCPLSPYFMWDRWGRVQAEISADEKNPAQGINMTCFGGKCLLWFTSYANNNNNNKIQFDFSWAQYISHIGSLRLSCMMCFWITRDLNLSTEWTMANGNTTFSNVSGVCVCLCRVCFSEEGVVRIKEKIPQAEPQIVLRSAFVWHSDTAVNQLRKSCHDFWRVLVSSE